MSDVRSIFVPFARVSRQTKVINLFVLIALVFVIWEVFPPFLIPRLSKVLAAFPVLWRQGIIMELWSSFMVNLKALLLTTIISLTLAYLVSVPFMGPAVEAVAKLRFLGMTGLTLPFTLAFGGGQPLKIAILTFGMTSYFVTAMADEVVNIPREKLDHARTLRYGNWGMVWEVVILGTLNRAFEIMRQIAGMSWAMVAMVEGIVRSEGGVGAALLARTRQFDKLPEGFAIFVLILITGILQDRAIRSAMKHSCEWATITLERR